MGFSYINGVQGSGAGSDGLIDTGSTLNVAAGDLLVAVVKFDGATTTISLADAADSGINQFEELAPVTSGSGEITSTMAYRINAAANAALTVRATLGANRAYRYVAVMQFRPDGGDTVTLNAYGTANALTTGGAHTNSSDQISPTGDDICVVGGIGNYAVSLSGQQIGNAAATGSVETDLGYGSIWYKLFTSDQTNIDADCDLSSSDTSIINILAFSSAAGVISGTTCWGHVDGVTEVNARTFATNWTGTGSITGSGNDEQLEILGGQYMQSEVVNTNGTQTVTVQLNKYGSGDSTTIKYRTGASQATCEAASWSTYSVPFESSGYIQVRLEAT